ncbi:hypothetical protein ACHAW6_007571 [Cyclotella cf. meneghiniana]
MSEQLKYCASIHFYDRCHQADNTNNNTYFHSRVAQSFAKCLESSTENITAVLESVIDVIDWSALFSNHNRRHAHRGASDNVTGVDSVKSALGEVCGALASILTKPLLRDSGVIVFLKIWSSHRTSTIENVWSCADQYMCHFIGALLLHANIQSATYFDRPGDLMLWCGLIKGCTSRISLEIESVFALNPSTVFGNMSKEDDCADYSKDGCSSVAKTSVRSEKQKLTATVRSWVTLLRDMNKQNASLSYTVSDALLAVLRALDDIDIKNLCLLPTLQRNFPEGKYSQAINSSLNINKRPRLPPSARSADFLEALHESSVNLGNNDRQQRAKREQLERQSCSNMQISLKEVLNAPSLISGSKKRKQFASHAAINSGSGRAQKYPTISSLTIEAALLRRDLYRYLVELDVLGISKMVLGLEDLGEQSISNKSTSTVDSLVSQLISRLLSTLEQFNSSPSTRLYIVLTLDHLRELHLGDKGYHYFLDQLLNSLNQHDCAKKRRNIFLMLFAEIVSECDLYAKPRHLLSALSMLMAMSLRCRQENYWRLLLQTISHLMLRRRNILLRLSEDGIQRYSEMKRFLALASKMSFEYGSSSYWIHHSMSGDEQLELFAILQATGILSLFGIDSEDVGYSSLYNGMQFPYPYHLSLRSAHTRLGPCPGYNNILTHPLAYKYGSVLKSPNVTVQYSREEKTGPPLPYLDNYILNGIFDFLGYRSVARASQCCQAWRDASKSNSRWLRLYFYKFPRAMLEEEIAFNANSHCSLLLDHRSSCQLEERISFPKSLEGYDWHFLFKKQYLTEKLARTRSLGKPTRFRSCDFVGCQEVLNERNLQSHWKKHAKNAKLQLKRKKELALLQQEFNAFDKETYYDEIVLGVEVAPKEMNSPESILQCFVFPFLDARELLQPVCKLWSELAQCNRLWQKLYSHHFGAPCPKWLLPKASSVTWKDYFHFAYKAKNLVIDGVNNFGWTFQVCPGCSSVLGSKLEFDLHMMKHKVTYFKDILKKTRAKHSSKPKPVSKT